MSDPRYIQIPTEPPTFVPLGLNELDMNLVSETMELWRNRISPPLCNSKYSFAPFFVEVEGKTQEELEYISEHGWAAFQSRENKK